MYVYTDIHTYSYIHPHIYIYIYTRIHTFRRVLGLGAPSRSGFEAQGGGRGLTILVLCSCDTPGSDI